MSINAAFDSDPQERATILHTIASNSDALRDLGDRLHDLQMRLHPLPPDAVPAPKSEGGDNVESLVEAQSTLIARHVETIARMLSRLA